MKKTLSITAVISTIFSVILNSILLFKDVDLTYFKPFLILQAVGYVLAGVSLFSIVMTVVYNKTAVTDRTTKRIMAVICIALVVFGCVYSVKTICTKYASSWLEDDTNIYDENISVYYPYKHEDNNYPRFFGDKFGDNTLLEFQNNHSTDGYRAVYFESKDIYLNKRFKLQFSPFLGMLYDFNSDLNVVTSTKKVNIDGVKFKVYIEDDADKNYAALISDSHHTLYVQLSYPTMDDSSLENFTNTVVAQFRLLTDIDVDEAFKWNY